MCIITYTWSTYDYDYIMEKCGILTYSSLFLNFTNMTKAIITAITKITMMITITER